MQWCESSDKKVTIVVALLCVNQHQNDFRSEQRWSTLWVLWYTGIDDYEDISWWNIVILLLTLKVISCKYWLLVNLGVYYYYYSLGKCSFCTLLNSYSGTVTVVTDTLHLPTLTIL